MDPFDPTTADDEALAQYADRVKVCEDCGDPWEPTDGLCSTCGSQVWTWDDDPSRTPGGGPCGCMGGTP